MADHSKPVLTSTYTNFVTELDARFDDLAVGLDPALTTSSNMPTGTIRWNSVSKYWEKYSGTAWAALDASLGYAISITGSAAKWTTARTITLNTDVTGSVVFDGSANFTLGVTLNTVTVPKGGTGVTTLTGLAYANGTSAYTAATAAQVVGVIGTTAVTNATNSTNATNLAGGLGGQIPYQSAVDSTLYAAAGTTGQLLTSNGTGAPSWINNSFAAKGANSDITSLAGLTTALSATQGGTGLATVGTSGNVLTSNGATWLSSGSPKDIQILHTSVSSFNLTISVPTLTLDFRSADASNNTGDVNRYTGSPANLVIPNGATLGLTNTVTRLSVLAVLNGTNIDIAVINNKSRLLDESNLIITTAISTSSDSIDIAYSNSQLGGVNGTAYRVIGYIDIGQETPGVWISNPDRVIGCGGLVLASSSTLGMNQLWVDVKASRAAANTYTNSTGRPIMVAISCTGSQSQNATLVIGGVNVAQTGIGTSNVAWNGNITGVVPNGATYSLTVVGAVINLWTELR